MEGTRVDVLLGESIFLIVSDHLDSLSSKGLLASAVTLCGVWSIVKAGGSKMITGSSVNHVMY